MSRRAALGWLASYVVLVSIAYWPSLGGEWVYDDHRFVASNEALTLSNALRFFHDPTTVDPEGNWEGIYRPLRSLSFAIDRTFFGQNPVGYRIHGLLVHILSALALGALLGRLLAMRAGTRAARGRARTLGFGAGLLYAVHPIHAESVAWVTSRADLESGLAAWCCLLLLVRRDAPAGRIVLGVLVGVIALFAKESAVMLPLIGLALAVFPARPRGGAIAWRRWCVLLALALAFVALRSAVLGGFAVQRDEATEAWPHRWPTMLTGLAWYLERLVWPSGFRFDYQLPVVDWTQSSPALTGGPSPVVVLALVLAAVGTIVVLARRRTGARFVLVGVAWFALALAPMSNLLISLNILVAERFLYLAAGGALLAVGGVVWGAVWGSWVAPRAVGVVVGLSAIAACTVGTFHAAAIWRTERGLWNAVKAHSPNHYRPYQGLAKVHVRAGKFAAATRALERALACPNGAHPDVYFDLGRVYLLAKDTGSAVRYLERAAVGWRERGVGAKNLRYRRTLVLLVEFFERVRNPEAVAQFRAWLAEAGGPAP